MTWLSFDEHDLTVSHDFWTWLWWSPDQTPRSGDKDASARTRLRWSEIHRLDASGAYPGIRVRYFTGDGLSELTLLPRGEPPADYHARVADLFTFARGRLDPDEVRSGWIVAPELAWEPFTRWPEDSEAILTSPYRTAADDGDKVRAIRGAPKPFEAMLQWLASGPERPWKEHPRRVVLTTDHVCVERRDRALMRVERARIRGRRDTHDGDRVYYFGRRLRLLLPGRDDACPVIWALDRDCHQRVGPPD